MDEYILLLRLVGTFEVYVFFFFQAEDGIRDYKVTGVQTCALPICQPGYRYDAPYGQNNFTTTTSTLTNGSVHGLTSVGLQQAKGDTEVAPDGEKKDRKSVV